MNWNDLIQIWLESEMSCAYVIWVVPETSVTEGESTTIIILLFFIWNKVATEHE